MPHVLDTHRLRERVQEVIDTDLAHQRVVLAELGPEMNHLVDAIASLMSGGKRLRAGFLYFGHLAAGGPDSDELVAMASSMEYFQAAALIHDDVMDNSDTRRGAPAAHRAFAGLHDSLDWAGSPEQFGVAGAILAGNLCLNWADELYAGCGLDTQTISRGRVHFDAMRTQLMGGQFLDVLHAARGWAQTTDPQERIAMARRVIRYKSAKYSVEQPVLIGAASGGAGEADLARLSTYGLALGEAFQLRDDLLGVFGDPRLTGKPAGDDLREGKHTVLVAATLALAGENEGRQLEDALGRADITEDEVMSLQRLITASGAVDAVEELISQGAEQARAALAETTGLDPAGAALLAELIDATTVRDA